MSYPDRHPIALLGLVADHKRRIKSGYEFDKYFPRASGSYDIINPNGTVKHTVNDMEAYVRETLADTAKIAPILKGDTLVKTCQNIWNFIYENIQYKLDKEGVEELRRPRRTWADRQTGVDCDCMSIFTSSILTNLGIKHKFRIAAYDANWQHVYVTVPLPNDPLKYYVIDCVLDEFNYQKPYSKKFDHKMEVQTLLGGIPIARLGGVENAAIYADNDLQAILKGAHIGCLHNVEDLGAGETVLLDDKPFLDSILKHIIATRDYISKNPDAVTVIGGAKEYLRMLDYAIAHWNTSNRDAALTALEKAENEWSKKPSMRGVSDAEDEIDPLDGVYDQELTDMLGSLGKKGAGKKFFNNIKKSVETVKKTVTTTNNKIINSAKDVAKKVDAANKELIIKAGGDAGKKLVEQASSIQQKVNAKAAEVQAQAKKLAQHAISETKKVAAKAGEIIKKFVVLSNPLTLMMRAGFLLAMKINLFGMASRLLPALLTESEAAKRNVPKAVWERSKVGLDKVAKVFEFIGGKRSKLEKHIREGRASKRKGLAGLSGEPYSTAAVIVAAAATLLTAAAKMREAGVNKRDYEQLKKDEDRRQAAAARKSVDGFGETDDTAVVEETPAETPTDESSTTPNSDEGSGSDGSEILEEVPMDEEQRKGFLKKFVEAIKKFFSKRKGEADVDASAIIAEEQASTPDSASELITGKKDEVAYEAAEAAAMKAATDAAFMATQNGATESEAMMKAQAAYSAAGGTQTMFPFTNVADLKASADAQAKLAAESKAEYERLSNEGFFSKVGRFVKENPKTSIAIGLGAAAVVTYAVSPSARQWVGNLLSGKKKSLSGVGKKRKKRKTTRRTPVKSVKL